MDTVARDKSDETRPPARIWVSMPPEVRREEGAYVVGWESTGDADRDGQLVREAARAITEAIARAIIAGGTPTAVRFDRGDIDSDLTRWAKGRRQGDPE